MEQSEREQRRQEALQQERLRDRNRKKSKEAKELQRRIRIEENLRRVREEQIKALQNSRKRRKHEAREVLRSLFFLFFAVSVRRGVIVFFPQMCSVSLCSPLFFLAFSSPLICLLVAPSRSCSLTRPLETRTKVTARCTR